MKWAHAASHVHCCRTSCLVRRVHYTQQAVNQAEYAVALLGPSVTAKELDRVTAALKGTASSYIIFACALFGLGLWRKLLSVEADVSGAEGCSCDGVMPAGPLRAPEGSPPTELEHFLTLARRLAPLRHALTLHLLAGPL